MILVDGREGSRDLAPLIGDHAVVVQLPFGDCCWEGVGADGAVWVGVERKRIGDLVNSIETGRLSGHQVPGMLKEYHRVYIVVEGLWAEGKDGGLLVRRGRGWVPLQRGRRNQFTVGGMWHYLMTLEEMTGVVVRMTVSAHTTAALINHLYSWWQKPWDKHKSHLSLHKPPPPHASLTGPPSLLRRVAAELPGIGWGRSLAVERRFRSLKEMWEAGEEEWREVEGIGTVVSKAVWGVLHGG